MRDYAKVSPAFWTGDTGRAIRDKGGTDAQLVALYLITCAQANMIGVYYIPIVLMSYETGIPSDRCKGALETLKGVGFAFYDPPSEWVWVPEMASYQIGDRLKPEDNRVKSIQREVEQIKNDTFQAMFMERYAVAFCLDKKFKPRFKKAKIPAKMRFQVLTRDGFRCKYCGADSTAARIDVDHVTPESEGGATELDNLVAACTTCNIGKATSISPSIVPPKPRTRTRAETRTETRTRARTESLPVEPAKKEKPRNLVFDAIAEVTGTDPVTNGPLIGTVSANLGKANPPYTPEEVREFGSRFWEFCPYAKREPQRSRPTPKEIEKNIGMVRAPPAPALVGVNCSALVDFVERGNGQG